MVYSALTPQDILTSSKVHSGHIFDYDPKKIQDNATNKKNNKSNKTVYDVTFIPIEFKKVNKDNTVSNVIIRNLSFDHVMVMGKPTNPPAGDGEVKNMTIVVRKISREDVSGGDYVVKEYDDPARQAQADADFEKLQTNVVNGTNIFIDALEAIMVGYENICKKIISDWENASDSGSSDYSFKLIKDSSWDIDGKLNVPIKFIKQSTRKDPSNPRKKIVMDTPLFRLKMPIKNGLAVREYMTNKEKIQTDYIYDMRKRKTSSNGKTSFEPAMIKNADGVLERMNLETVPRFITYKSLIFGSIEFPKVVISKQGMSLSNEFREMIVKRHKVIQSLATPSVSNDVYLSMTKFGSNDPDDDDNEEAVVPEVAVKTAEDESMESLGVKTSSAQSNIPIKNNIVNTAEVKVVEKKSLPKAVSKKPAQSDDESSEDSDSEEVSEDEQTKPAPKKTFSKRK